jgi:hypothetical protein
MLRKEYLNQTFNFMPNVQEEYDKVTRALFYDKAQVLITEKEDYDRLGLSKYLIKSYLKYLINRFIPFCIP